MEDIKGIIITVSFCGLAFALAAEMLPAEQSRSRLRFLMAVMFVVLIGRRVASFDIATELPVIEPTENEYSGLMDDFFSEAVEENTAAVIGEALSRGGVHYTKIDLDIHINSDNSITINKAVIYCDDCEAAEITVSALLGEEVEVQYEQIQ